MQTSANVLLPQTPGPYRPWLLLHGLSDDHTIWLRRTSLDRYLEGTNYLVVMPHGGRGFYTDAAHGPAYSRAVGQELPDLIARWFPVQPEWAISGLSMGGYGALALALRYPDRFRSAVSHSGAVGFGYVPDYAGDLARRNGLDVEWSDAFRKEFGRILGDDSRAVQADLFHLFTTANSVPRLRIDCGTEDGLLNVNRQLQAHLEALGIVHEYAEFPGGHDWAYWDDRVQEAIEFHRASLG